MADVIFSAVAERIVALIEEQIRDEVNLVRGAETEVRKLADELMTIRDVLDDAEKRGFKETSIKNWLKKLEHTSYEMDDVLDEWNYAMLKQEMGHDDQSDDAVAAPPKHKVCSFIPSSCLCFKKVVARHDIGKKILNVKAKLDEVLKETDRYNFVMSQPTPDPSPKSWRDPSTSFTDLAEVRGRDSDRDILVTKLMANVGGQEKLGSLQVLSIVGVWGLGKTTLAQLVYNDSRVEESFELSIWVCVSDPFDLAAIAKGIIESVKKGNSPSTTNLETLLQCVRDSISGKRFLLVLDDVWTEDSKKWEPLKISLECGGAGSKILVTTRNRKVAEIMGTMDDDIHSPEQLTNEECWLLLRNEALSQRNKEEFENFKDVGKKIAKKCDGLPLAAKTLGSLLLFKNTFEEWENVLNSEIWEMEEAKVDLFPHLLLSYNELSPTLKRCFSYCAVFPKDSEINVEYLIGNWMALGYLGSNTGDMELKGRECFEVLAMRSLFQDFKKDLLDGQISSCKMHDIVHDFTQFLRKSDRVEATGMNKTTCRACDPLLVCTVNEFSSLFWENGSPPSLCDCLTRMRVLSLRQCGLKSIPQGMRNLIHLRRLSLGKNTLSCDDLKIIFQLYNLQILCLDDCSLEEIPREIENLINLRLLNLSGNKSLKELPESICVLLELRTLRLNWCDSLSGLPEGIHRLKNLKHIFNVCFKDKDNLIRLPQGLARSTGLCTLRKFRGGSGWNKLGLLKDLNRLSGYLELKIRLTDNDLEDVVEDAREAELRKKNHIKDLRIRFDDEMDEEEESSQVRMDVIDALEPHPDLQLLFVLDYQGSKFPGWITSPVNRVKEVHLCSCNYVLSLPPLGQLPCLEEIFIIQMKGLEFVGRESLGLTKTIGGGGDISNVQSSSNTCVIAFPKLKKLTFEECSKWKEWEDITAEEEESAAVSVMPCLENLRIIQCKGLTALPHRLLRKASSLKKLEIISSRQLKQRYRDKDGSAWKSISENHPHLKLLFV